MQPIRPFVPEDIPRVARLFERAMLDGGRLAPSGEEYYRQIFFESPWVDDELPSLVYETKDGDVEAFIGVVPRPMRFGGQRVRAAVTTQFMVDPNARNKLAGVLVLRACFGGSQDLTIADNAGDVGRHVWEGCGGIALPLQSLDWSRPLRPFAFAGSRLARGPIARSLVWLTKPGQWAADGLAAGLRRSPLYDSTPDSVGESLSRADMATHLAGASFDQTLAPAYDAPGLEWLLGMMEKIDGRGAYHRVVVRKPDGGDLGWYQYYLKPGGISQVVQVGGAPQHLPSVVEHLFHHAREGGAHVVKGRLDPRLMRALPPKQCIFNRGSWALFHSRTPEILQALNAGDAFFSRLDGEWWINFADFKE